MKILTSFQVSSNSIQSLSDSALHDRLIALSTEERRITAVIIEHLQEVESRRLYATRGHPSLFEYVTKELGFSEGAAHRRISSMRLARELPEIREKIEDGSLKLNQLAQVQRFLKEERKQGKFYSKEKKRDLLVALQGRSTRETERSLAAISPESMIPEKVRPLSDSKASLQLTVEAETLRKLDRIRELAAYRIGFDANYGKTLEWMADRILKQLEKEKGIGEQTDSLPALEVNSAPKNNTSNLRRIPAPTLRAVWRRDQAQCTYFDPNTNRRCSATHGLQLDHKFPVFHGGEPTLENLQLLCSVHNRMKGWVPSPIHIVQK